MLVVPPKKLVVGRMFAWRQLVVELMSEDNVPPWTSVPSAARGGVVRWRIKQTGRGAEIDAVLVVCGNSIYDIKKKQATVGGLNPFKCRFIRTCSSPITRERHCYVCTT